MCSWTGPWWGVPAVSDRAIRAGKHDRAIRAGEPDRVIRAGERLADEVEVFLVEARSVSAELQRDRVDRAEESRSWGMGIRVIRGGCIGASSTSDPGAWERCLQAAVDSARLATPQEWKGLPGPGPVAGEAPCFDPAVVPSPEAAGGILGRMLEGVAAHPDARVTSGSATLSRATLTLSNSHGLERTMERTECGCSLEAICGQSTGSEFDQSPFRDIDPVKVGEQAGFLAVHSAGGEAVADGRYPVILSPVAVAQLLGYIVVPALSGRNVHAGRSRLAPLLSTRCMDPALDLRDDPFARGLGATAWDAEGVPSRRIDFVREGMLLAFAYDLKTAYRYGKETTASAVRGGFGGSPSIGVHTLVLDGKRSDITRDRALYVHDVVGAHTANPMSGDFSVECQNPAWMEDGILREPVRKAMIAGNFFDALADLGGIGPDSRMVGNAILPPLRLKNLQVIGA